MASKKTLPASRDAFKTESKQRDMTNTVAFSSDMENLYIIDDGKVNTYNLSHPNGVLVGTLRGQITAATAEALPASSDVLRTVTLNLQKNHWTAFYRRPQQTLNVIGATDIDLGFTGEGDGKATLHRFIIGGNPVHIRRSGQTITLSLIKA